MEYDNVSCIMISRFPASQLSNKTTIVGDVCPVTVMHGHETTTVHRRRHRVTERRIVAALVCACVCMCVYLKCETMERPRINRGEVGNKILSLGSLVIDPY